MPKNKKESPEKAVKPAPKKVTPKAEEKKVEETPKMPTFEGVKVRKVLDDKKSTATHFHCKMEDETTRHVPKSLFK